MIVFFTAIHSLHCRVLAATGFLHILQIQAVFGEKKNPQAKNNGYDLK